MTWINVSARDETRDRHEALVTGAIKHSRHLRRILYVLSERWSSIRIAEDLRGRRTSSQRRRLERKRWNCPDEREIIACCRFVNYCQPELLDEHFLFFPQFIRFLEQRELSVHLQELLSRCFTVRYFYFGSSLRLLDFPFGTSLFAL